MTAAFLTVAAGQIQDTSHNAQDYPLLKTGNQHIDKAFTLAVETLFKNTPDSLIKAGGEYGGEWTRDVSINSWNAAALLMPEKTAYSLWSVTTDNRSFIGHQYWDQIIWVTGAYDYYQKTGDKAFLRQAYVASANTMNKLENEQFDADYGMFMGPSVFNDGIAGYEEPIFDTAHRSSYVLDYPGAKRIKCLSTNSIYYNAYVTLAKMAVLTGDKAAEKTYTKKAADLRAAIRKHLFDAKTGRLSYLVDAEGDVHPHQETLGVAFAILFGVVSDAEAQKVIANVYTGKHGVPSIYPHFKRFDKEHPGRHSLRFLNNNGIHELMATYDEGKKMAPFVLLASTGTMALFLFYIWSISAFDKISFLFIDEFDAFFHFESAENIVKRLNKAKQFQTILTSHNTYLMQNQLTRPDCCYIMTENRITSLFNSTDKELREAHNLEKMYVNGVFNE